MSSQKSSYQKWIICGFVLGIILFSIINIINCDVFNLGYLIMLIVYFIRFLYLMKVEG